MCTKNDNHMMYGSWDTEWDRQNFLSFWATFALLPNPLPPNDPENQNFDKNEKECQEVLSLYTYVCTINEDHMIYGSWKLPGNPENQNFKIEKNTWRYYHFTHLHYKWQSYHVWFLRYGARQTEFFCHSGTFFALLPPYGPKKSTFWKNEKKQLKVLSFYKCERDRENFLSFWTVF